MNQVQVSIPCRTPSELQTLQDMAKKLFRCGLKSTIIQKGSSYTLWRDILDNEGQTPLPFYWEWNEAKNCFSRNEAVAKKYRKSLRKDKKNVQLLKTFINHEQKGILNICLSQKLKKIN